jgi:hypothetical protein
MADKIDPWLMRSKDLLLVGGALWTLFVWGAGFIGIPQRVQQTEMNLVNLEARSQSYDKANELFHAGIGKDIEYIKLILTDLKRKNAI